MVKRDCALWNDQLIGIETIYTVNSQGKQINIPEKVEELRKKGQNNELFCPCGCGINLALVAGDKSIRDQHFRAKDSGFDKECHVVTEGKNSVDSKVVIKCWLEDKLHANDIEARVPISDISDSDRKYEFSFLSVHSSLAVNYCNNRLNLSDEKLRILDAKSANYKIIHIIDMSNEGTNGQYPENLMKIQNRQGYILLLSVRGREYASAHLKATFYEKNLDDEWQEIVFADGLLREFYIDKYGFVTYLNKRVDDMLARSREEYAKELQLEKEKRRKAEEVREARAEQLRIEIERKRLEEQKRADEVNKKKAEEAEQKRIKAEKEAEASRRADEEFQKQMNSDFTLFDKQIKDRYGNRWVQCKFCGKKGKAESDFWKYGGMGKQINLGICYDCNGKGLNKLHEVKSLDIIQPTELSDLPTCLKCGAKMKLKNGKYGKFLGCTRYPDCDYTERIN